ncbi:ankyrin repeat domain-containing protein 42-like [Branchiostoma lanceolatum]|uniref:ankyrin repeat domain-containing protein 42-like n=1 Tax=Branchiostoma lanceolatum TaxID=7740 RepID=UPI00345449A0
MSQQDDNPLHKAATHGHHDCAEVLLQHGADTGIRNGAGRTAEDIAADEDTGGVYLVNKDEKERIIRGRKEILRLLREEKSKGRTADDIAADEDTGGVSTCNKDEGERRTRSRKEMLTLLQRDSNGVFASKEYNHVLVRFYEEKGMTVAKKNCPLIQEAAKESGKSVARVII